MKNSPLTVRQLTRIALMSALIAVCAWINIPLTVPFTLQLLGVFLALRLLGGRDGTLCIALYILLGAVGLPVFANFSAGISALIGPTGGYILGFLLMGVLYWLLEKHLTKRLYLAGSCKTRRLRPFGRAAAKGPSPWQRGKVKRSRKSAQPHTARDPMPQNANAPGAGNPAGVLFEGSVPST